MHFAVYLFMAQVPVTSWFDDMSDTELLDIVPFFESLAKVDSAYALLRSENRASGHTVSPSDVQPVTVPLH